MGVFSFGPYTYDSRTAELRMADRRIRLHPQPSQVLQLLLTRPGEVVSRHEIKNELWSMSTYVDFDLGINSCIRQIRSALADAAENPVYIQTVPRRGYRFIARVEKKSSQPGIAATTETTNHLPSSWRVALPLVLALMTLVAVWQLRSGSNESPSPSKGLAGKSGSVAVLPADNLSGDATLDGLRLRLADLLITALSLQTDLDVVPMEQLQEMMGERGALEEGGTTIELIEEVHRKTDADAVLLCSFMKSGDRIRVNARLQDAKTGVILWTDKAEVVGDDLVPVVDLLARHIKEECDASSTLEPDIHLRLEDVTTNSPEAYQLYTEGLKLHLDGHFDGATALFEKATAIDPEFALALTRLSAAYANLGHTVLAEEYGRRAFEHRNKLSPLERYYVEGMYYGLREETYELAIETYRKAIQFDPNFHPPRHNLGTHYLNLERYDEALVHLERDHLSHRTFVGTYRLIAMAYHAMGHSEKALEALRSYVEMHPESPYGYQCLGYHLTADGKLDVAWLNFQKAQSLAVGNYRVKQGMWAVLALRDQWSGADEIAREMESSTDSASRSAARYLSAISSLYHGRYNDTLRFLDEAATAHNSPGTPTAVLYNLKARVQLSQGDAAQALALAEKAQKEAKGHFPEWQALDIASLAQAKLGRLDQACETAEELRERTKQLPTKKETRRYHALLGKLSLIEGNVDRAIDELERAVSMLPARGLHGSLRSDTAQHVFIWCSLARAYLEAGDEASALRWYRRVSEAGTERLWWPVQFVRSFYFLGKINEKQGDKEKARDYYRRFYEYWKDGDMDRDRVEEARSFLDSI